MAFGLIFYFFTIVSSLKSPDCPFQTPVSTVLQHVLPYILSFRTVVRQKWKGRPKTWGGFLESLRETSKRVLCIGRDKITRPIMDFVSRQLTALRDNSRPAVNNSEATEIKVFLGQLDLSLLEPSIEIAQSHAIQSRAVRWIIETSTDMDNIAAAAGMVPEIEWTAAEGVTDMRDRLGSHFHVCFDPTGHISPLAQARAVACFKAISQCSVEQSRDIPFTIYPAREIWFWQNGLRISTMAPRSNLSGGSLYGRRPRRTEHEIAPII